MERWFLLLALLLLTVVAAVAFVIAIMDKTDYNIAIGSGMEQMA